MSIGIQKVQIIFNIYVGGCIIVHLNDGEDSERVKRAKHHLYFSKAWGPQQQ